MVRADFFDMDLFENDLNNWFVILCLVLLEGRGKRKWPGGATEEDTKNSSDFCQLGHRCLLRGRHYQKLPSPMSKCKFGMAHFIHALFKVQSKFVSSNIYFLTIYLQSWHWHQSWKNPVSASAMLTGKFLQIRKAFATSSLLAEEFSDTLQYKISRKYAKCPDELESFRTI